jgi:hypothetical protein
MGQFILRRVKPRYLVDRDGVSMAPRSAIAVRGDNICFEVSNVPLTMSDWATVLQGRGVDGALNLDGGPLSSMAYREPNGKVVTNGLGKAPAHLMVFAYVRKLKR